jgi:Flp pilus assembly protein TadG
VRAWFTRRSSHRHERGTALIEFALIFPAFCGLLFGIIDGGRFIGARVMLSQAVAEGARVACLSDTLNQATVDAAVAGSSTMLPGARIDWAASTCTPGGCGTFPRSVGDALYLTIQYDFQASFFRGFTRNMRQTSRMVCE